MNTRFAVREEKKKMLAVGKYRFDRPHRKLGKNGGFSRSRGPFQRVGGRKFPARAKRSSQKVTPDMLPSQTPASVLELPNYVTRVWGNTSSMPDHQHIS